MKTSTPREEFLATWGRYCGAPLSVFTGHLDALLREVNQEKAAEIKALRVEVERTRAENASPTWPYVLAFARVMEAKLEKNRHKGDREGWLALSFDELYRKMEGEWYEVKTETVRKTLYPERYEVGSIVKECADLANFALMIADVAGELAIDVSAAPEGGDG